VGSLGGTNGGVAEAYCCRPESSPECEIGHGEKEQEHGEDPLVAAHLLGACGAQAEAYGHAFKDDGGGRSHCSWRDGDRGHGRCTDGGGRRPMLT
jgi:hypothetical protein